jgi:hypothetical protein
MLTLLPRVLTVSYIAFISLFALDVFESGYGWLKTLIALFMHLIPSFLLIAALVVAWKKPVTGGAHFLILAIIFTLWFTTYHVLSSFLLVSFPLLVIGALFIISGIYKRGV